MMYLVRLQYLGTKIHYSTYPSLFGKHHHTLHLYKSKRFDQSAKYYHNIYLYLFPKSHHNTRLYLFSKSHHNTRLYLCGKCHHTLWYLLDTHIYRVSHSNSFH